jgi:hypothetical protein
MEDTHPDFPPLTTRQKILLDEIKSLKEELEALPPWNPQTMTWVPEFYEIRKKIDEYTVKLIRSGVIKRGTDKLFYFPPEAFAWAKKKRLDKPQIQHYYHPQLPSWAREYLEEWIPMRQLREDGPATLRETGVVGLETGMKRPKNGSEIKRWELIRRRVFELRGAKYEENEVDDGDGDGDMSPAMANEPPPYTLAEIIEGLRDEMIKNAKPQYKACKKKKRKRTRKNSASWDMVIDKLVEEKLLTKKITHQAFRKSLEKHLPDTPWNKV